jgi:hypothetical protein
MTSWTPYDSLSSQEMTDIARCAARDPHYSAISPRWRRMGSASQVLYFLVFPSVVTLAVRNVVLNMERWYLVRRLRRAHGGAGFTWPELVSELRRRDETHRESWKSEPR